MALPDFFILNLITSRVPGGSGGGGLVTGKCPGGVTVEVVAVGGSVDAGTCFDGKVVGRELVTGEEASGTTVEAVAVGVDADTGTSFSGEVVT